jgi:hypothetical protein
MSLKRRRATRYQFIAEAEVTELKAGMKFKAKTGDLSIGGCFLSMLNPPAEGTEILVTIFRESVTCTAHGRVVFVFPNMGMGVEFTRVEAIHSATLHGWLSELSGETAHCTGSHTRPR